MEEGSSFTEIDHCLLIHDNRHEDEGAADTELVLFFWPNHVELGQCVFRHLIGSFTCNMVLTLSLLLVSVKLPCLVLAHG